MSIELRKNFETELNIYLKENLTLTNYMKILKNRININRIGDINVQGELSWGYLNNANGYFLSLSIDSIELNDFFNEIAPPYKSNLLTDNTFFMNTLMEKFKLFATKIGGTVDLPRNEEEISKTCEWIFTKIRDIYLPRVMNLIDLKSDAINDVIANPNYYAYPFLTILYIIKKNNIPLSDIDMDFILSKKITGNKLFDKNLLDTYL
ncbi:MULTISPECIES: hypothetical protein [unclassified Brenneria]|uniref:hypothetical protein n=1 Tax=unclassified Brenneria TaxID=2634434 RepID=UPI0029C501AC|nr:MULTISPECIES: hypothetical protein [unclassified Brenneria]MDX5630941.1 hypothetical protein [Brenneria sp. L3-3Z]MDX5698022.1 hypothetical protein [Brenneria sp. L4-2C]